MRIRSESASKCPQKRLPRATTLGQNTLHISYPLLLQICGEGMILCGWVEPDALAKSYIRVQSTLNGFSVPIRNVRAG